jgi:polysaccharide biosynthesis transport protein
VLALTLGLILGVGVAVSIEYFDTSFRNVADIESQLGVPVVGVIPQFADASAFDPDDLAATEPFRVLHTSLNLLLPQKESTAIVIVSAGPGEGKSTTVNRLAGAIASSGHKVILIDGDMRRPTQHRLGNWKRSPGLSEYLHGKASLQEIVQTAAGDGLNVIGSGSHSGFSFSLRHAERMRELVAELKTTYDRVLFDSPPIIGVSDASILASCMDGALLLIQHRRNPRAMTSRAQHVLASAQTPLIGAILNQVPPDSGEDYGYYAHNYTYYGSGEGKRSKKSSSRDAATTEKNPPEHIDLHETDK